MDGRETCQGIRRAAGPKREREGEPRLPRRFRWRALLLCPLIFTVLLGPIFHKGKLTVQVIAGGAVMAVEAVFIAVAVK